jgi:hypothetical protein
MVVAALIMLTTVLMTVSKEWPSNELVIYGERFIVRLDWRARTKYVIHMLD